MRAARSNLRDQLPRFDLGRVERGARDSLPLFSNEGVDAKSAVRKPVNGNRNAPLFDFDAFRFHAADLEDLSRFCHAKSKSGHESPDLPMKISGDPNGIRTRVTAVKGRCPRPLDDRVVRARAISEVRPCLASYLHASHELRLPRAGECRFMTSSAVRNVAPS